jgi:hypothetical protein
MIALMDVVSTRCVTRRYDAVAGVTSSPDNKVLSRRTHPIWIMRLCLIVSSFYGVLS